MKKRFLAMGLVFLLLFLSVGPTSIAYNINKKNNSEDLPDIITKIRACYYMRPPMYYFVFGLFCVVKNIGASIEGDFSIGVYVEAKLYNSSSKTFEHYNSFSAGYGNTGGLETGEIVSVLFSVENDYEYIHPYGIIKFICHASISREEANTRNNNCTKIYYHPGYERWIPLIHSFQNNHLINQQTCIAIKQYNQQINQLLQNLILHYQVKNM